ncbi:MltA domain-containing protein [Desulfovibrio sp. OttesenSCG-928-F07]|nr:MltA domain-containing protein [Desulfovibrio sp. OttesenSCG-928-F07]
MKILHTIFKHTSFAVLLVFVLLLTGCPAVNVRNDPARYASLEHMRVEAVDVKEARELTEGLSAPAQGLKSWNDLRFAIEQSLDFVQLRPAHATALVLPGDDRVPISWGDLRASLLRMLEILPYLDVNPGLLADEFTWLRLTPEFGFTGYYEPTIRADSHPGPIYRYPIYAMPKDLKPGKQYLDRHSIDRKQALAGKGLELAWVADDIDIFFLQIQGSGRLVYPDGKVRHVLYAGKNGHAYVPLGRVMRERGLLEPDNVNMNSIRTCLNENPSIKDELLDTNPSYVFFRLEDDGPVGSMGRILTPRVSLAIDPRVLPYGSLLFFNVDLPDQFGVHNRNTQALALPQDSGGAIKGRRIDLFMGAGNEAEHVAGHLNSEGTVYILMPVTGGSFTRYIEELE